MAAKKNTSKSAPKKEAAKPAVKASKPAPAEKKPAANRVHTTMKPVELIERALANSSKAGDLVVDLFGGSGSALIACEKTARHARLAEIDPRYADVIVSRWQDFTGLEATLDADGRTFAKIKSERFLTKLGSQDVIEEEVVS